jgi:hypothetical protein
MRTLVKVDKLLARISELEAEVERLRAALVEREARVLWQLDNPRKTWALARDGERDEYRDYARVSLRDKQLLPPE